VLYYTTADEKQSDKHNGILITKVRILQRSRPDAISLVSVKLHYSLFVYFCSVVNKFECSLRIVQFLHLSLSLTFFVIAFFHMCLEAFLTSQQVASIYSICINWESKVPQYSLL